MTESIQDFIKRGGAIKKLPAKKLKKEIIKYFAQKHMGTKKPTRVWWKEDEVKSDTV